MEKLIIPPNTNWYSPSIFHCIQDEGSLYGAMTKVVYVPSKNSKANVKVFDLMSKVFSLSVNPNWSESQYFAVINSDFHVLVYDFNSGEVIKGHKGHEKEQNSIPNQYPPTALAFLSQNAILSSINSSVVYFDLPTNSFKFFFNLSSRNPITIFKQSPIDSNLVAAGTKNGLILLLKVDKMQIIARLRQHDTEICSLDWFYFTKKSSLANVSLSNLIADSSDCFDIYEDLREDNEFGVTRGGFDDSDLEAREKVTSDANFDFLEACKSLKDQILEEPAEEIQDKTEKYQENRDQYGIKDKKCEPEVSSEDSIASNASSRTPHLTSDSDDAPEKKEFVFVSKKDVRSCDEIAMLASGSKEQFIWIWNIDEKVSIHKISYHPKKQSALPQPFTNVMWMNQENLIITDGNGNLNEYNINFDFKTKKITSKLNQNKRFYIQGVLNLCRYEDNIWTSSIHRNISCIDYKTNKKVISLDTIQLRIHYLVENHFDSNLIAIGGNDKRICLWNTSQATKQEISLRPFMNKIKCAVLCLSWHPEKENLLAFSTREGRIGILDVNKSTNVPIILPSFQSKEVYSISWKKIDDDIVLFACDRQNFVSFSQKNNWKLNKNYNHLKQIASIAFKENLAILGNDSGEILICKIDEDFKILSQKKLSKKYIGMMTLHGSNLAVAVESGFYLIENFGDEILDENLIHFDDNQSRTFTVKFNKNGNLIVSASDDGLVRVFDIEKREKISSYNLNTPVYAALFMPNNEDFIICGGNDSTLVSYEWKNYQDSVNNNLKSKKKGKANKSIQWATASEITTTAKNSQRQKKLKVENVDELSKEIDKISLKDKKSSSLFTSANRELTVDPLEFIERMLTPGDRVKSFHEQIFGDRENVKKLLDDEIQNKQPISMILPQLNEKLKEEIASRVSSKTLTEAHVAIAPSISFDFWKNTCTAFALQCVQNGDSINAIPYFLAVNEVNNTIISLCETKHFREAWIIAKMRKFNEDPIFTKIFKDWLEFLDQSGSYESAAALLSCKGDYKIAAEYLAKRQNKSEKQNNLIKMLQNI